MASRFVTAEPPRKPEYYMIFWLIQTMVAHPQLWNFHTSKKELTVSLKYLIWENPQSSMTTRSTLLLNRFCSCSVVKSCPTLQPHVLQYARHPVLPCPSPEVYSNSCLLSRWCHPVISSTVIPFSSCLQPFPASGFFFPMSWHFASGGQSIGTSASVLPMNVNGWFLF